MLNLTETSYPLMAEFLIFYVPQTIPEQEYLYKLVTTLK